MQIHSTPDASLLPGTFSSVSPISLDVPGRKVSLEIKVSAPLEGDSLPVIVLSHGHGRSNYLSSYRGYGPLADFYAAQGFVVVQPTHLDSKTIAADSSDPEAPLFWKSRVLDVHAVLDRLEAIETLVPGLAGRVDRERVAAVGHSLGGHTVSMLAGMQLADPSSGQVLDLKDARIKAAVIIAGPGDPKDLAPFAAEHFPVMKTLDFKPMLTPSLIVAGDKDKNPMFSERDDWRADAYYLSDGPKDLLTVIGGEHILGGISGYDAAETTDENPERVALVQQATLAYIRSALYEGDSSWEGFKAKVAAGENAPAAIASKGY